MRTPQVAMSRPGFGSAFPLTRNRSRTMQGHPTKLGVYQAHPSAAFAIKCITSLNSLDINSINFNQSLHVITIFKGLPSVLESVCMVQLWVASSMRTLRCGPACLLSVVVNLAVSHQELVNGLDRCNRFLSCAISWSFWWNSEKCICSVNLCYQLFKKRLHADALHALHMFTLRRHFDCCSVGCIARRGEHGELWKTRR